MKTSNLAIAVLFVVAIASSAVAKENPDPPPFVVKATITADNGYGFGFGPASGMTTYYGGIVNREGGEVAGDVGKVVNPGDIPTDFGASIGWLPHVGAETYILSFNPVAQQTHDYDYLYIVAWDDAFVTQGVLAGFQLGNDGPLLTGGDGWKVFATGIPKSARMYGDGATGIHDLLTLDDLPAINAQVQIANACAGGPNTSTGWVDQNGWVSGPDYPFVFRAAGPNYPKLAIGGKNDTIGAISPSWPDQPITTEISPDARWMWYNSNNAADPFVDWSLNTSIPYTD